MNSLLISAPGFMSALAEPIEQNRRRSHSYVEDSAIEVLPKMACSRDAEIGKLFIYGS